MTNDLKLKLDPQALRVLKNLTNALDDVAKALQISNRQKPKNSEIRLTEPDGGREACLDLSEVVEKSEGSGIPGAIPIKLAPGSIKLITEAVQPYLKDRRNDTGAF